MDNFEKVEGEELKEVTGGADTSRDELVKKLTENIVSKLPPRHKIKIFCCKCRKSSDGWMSSDFSGILRCPECGSAHVITKDTDEFETKN